MYSILNQPVPVQIIEREVDNYLSKISDESLEVLEHFGAEAPVLLNKYCCSVEDALIEQTEKVKYLTYLLEQQGVVITDDGRVAKCGTDLTAIPAEQRKLIIDQINAPAVEM